jgi:cbb3-type cytochrome oxidase subunit 1/cbb3-type cytochrome oxidase cytochrome c subunit/cytochrome c553
MATLAEPPPPAFTETGLVRAHGLAALAMVGYTALLGLAVAAKFHLPDLMGDASWLTWGRMRYGHTQGVFFGWLGNAFLAFCYYAVPRLAERPVTSRRLGWLLFVAWNFLLVIPGWALVQAGFSQPLEWAEFPLVIDAVAVAGLFLACVQFVLPFFRTRLADLYVSGWYVLGGLVFTLLAYPVGNIVPELEPGARGAAYSGLWIHDAVGLFVTPLALAIPYVVIPATTRKPIFSHFLSMIGFWLLFLVYPLNGTHHYVFSSIPMEAQQGAVVASVYLGVDVILVVANLLLSLRGAGGLAYRDVPLRFVWVGVVSYLVVSMQGSLQALMPVNRFVHFSDWVVGHAHLAMIGFASFTAAGGLLHVWQRLPGLRYNARAADWSFWLLATGMGVMVLDLTAAGLVQGHLWQSEAPWLDSVRASRPYWLVRTLAGGPILLGFAALALALTTGPREDDKVTRWQGDKVTEDNAASSVTLSPPHPVTLSGAAAWLGGAYAVTAVAGVGFFALSFVVLAVWPNRVLDREVAEASPPGLAPLSAGELRGRHVYAREGCVNCHTQLIRSTEGDVRRFGVASQAWETANEFPQLWGTRRVGPDLARQSGRKSRDWHLAHLYNPRWVVPDSNMPPYPWLFDGSPARPTQEALDLVSYLESLGRDAQLAGVTGPRPLPGLDPEEEKRRGMFCDCAVPRTPGPAVRLSTRMEASERQRFARRGAEAFARNCAGCHGQEGRGDGPAAVALLPRPSDLSGARYSDQALSEVLWQGVKGSAMPGWHDLAGNDLRGLAAFVRSLEDEGGGEAPALTGAEQERARALFAKNCATCHGAGGEGNGQSASTLAPAPTRFTLVRPSPRRAEHALAEGVPGTAMPAWKSKLSEAERGLLARFARTLYREE